MEPGSQDISSYIEDPYIKEGKIFTPSTSSLPKSLKEF